jgi:hypothetical protein
MVHVLKHVSKLRNLDSLIDRNFQAESDYPKTYAIRPKTTL